MKSNQMNSGGPNVIPDHKVIKKYREIDVLDDKSVLGINVVLIMCCCWMRVSLEL